MRTIKQPDPMICPPSIIDHFLLFWWTSIEITVGQFDKSMGPSPPQGNRG